MIEKALNYILDVVPSRNKFIPIGSMTENPFAIPCLWEWFESNIEALEQLHPVHYERIIAAIVPVCGLGREERVKTFFENYLRKTEKPIDVIQLSLERLQINSEVRKREN